MSKKTWDKEEEIKSKLADLPPERRNKIIDEAKKWVDENLSEKINIVDDFKNVLRTINLKMVNVQPNEFSSTLVSAEMDEQVSASHINSLDYYGFVIGLISPHNGTIHFRKTQYVSESIRDLNWIVAMLTDIANMYRRETINGERCAELFESLMSTAFGSQNPLRAARELEKFMLKVGAEPNFSTMEKKK